MQEEREQSIILANWLRYNHYTFTHIANESGLPPHVAMLAAKKKKAMGVSKGVPDFMIVLKTKGLLFIEMKRLKGGRVSPEQVEWINSLNTIASVEAIVCCGAEDAINTVEAYETKKTEPKKLTTITNN